MLRVEGLCVRYGRVTAVRDVSLEVGEGQLVGLIGPNGAGKSSTLMAIAGAVRRAAGTVTLNGEPLAADPEATARSGIRLVPEGRDVFARLTVAENLRLGATLRRDRAAVEEDVERELDRFPVLRRRFGQNAACLSGGEQQQLVIARALLGRPRVLLLDEPSLGLAPLMVDAVFDALERLREEGMTVLLVEQVANRTAELADRTYLLRGGSVVASGTAEELHASDDIESAYLGRKAVGL